MASASQSCRGDEDDCRMAESIAAGANGLMASTLTLPNAGTGRSNGGSMNLRGGVLPAILWAAVVWSPSERLAAQFFDGPDPWFSTFSIIAFDPATSELGVGVQSRAFGAGAAVPFAKPGV